MPRILFSTANARQMAARSHEARRLRLAQAESHADSPTAGRAPVTDSYLLQRLARVREQLRRLDDWISEELKAKTADGQPRQPDGQRIDRLAAASARLTEIERTLAGRPLPGSLRPREPRSRPGPWSSAEPLEE